MNKNTTEEKKQKKSRKKIFWIIFAMVLLIAIGLGAWLSTDPFYHPYFVTDF